LGSSPECSIQLSGEGISLHHLTLVFGKKLTLLRAVAPTRVNNRLVREWLIDHPTEIQIGECRLVIHPSINAMATVVHAEGLLEQAARLCKEPTPIVTESLVVAPPTSMLPAAATSIATAGTTQTADWTIPQFDLGITSHSTADPSPRTESVPDVSSNASTEQLADQPENSQPTASQQVALEARELSEIHSRVEAHAASLDAIETLLTSLQSSLEKLHETFGTETKQSTEVISRSVSSELDSFGKTWFTKLSEQFNSQTERQQTMITGLVEQVTDRFGAIDDQLNRFTESSSQQTNYLNELLDQAKAEQQLIHSRFQEVIGQRDELMQAVEVLRAEITSTYQQSYIDNAVSQGIESRIQSFTSLNLNGSTADPRASDETASSPAVDQHLVESLERAQLQIQNLNQQLMALESEKDMAQQWVASISDSMQSEPQMAADQAPQQIEYEQNHAHVEFDQSQAYSEQQTPQEYVQYGEPVHSQDAYPDAYSESQPQSSPSYSDEQANYGWHNEYNQSHEPNRTEEPLAEASYLQQSYRPEQADHEPGSIDPSANMRQDAESHIDESYPSEPLSPSDYYGEQSSNAFSRAESEQQPSHAEAKSQDDEYNDVRNLQLPAWFTQDEPPAKARNADEGEQYDRYKQSPSRAQPYASAVPLTPEDLNSNDERLDVSDEMQLDLPESDSVSERLQRMLQDAEQRRNAPANAASNTSRRWSQTFNQQQPYNQQNPSLQIDGSNPSERSFGPKSQAVQNEIGDLLSAFKQNEADRAAGLQEASQPNYRDIPDDSAESELLARFEASSVSAQSETQPEPTPTHQERLQPQEPPAVSQRRESYQEEESSSAEPGSDSEEESIEEYMQRLLQRVRGDSGAPQPAVAETKSPARKNTGGPTKPGQSRVAASLGIELEPAVEASVEPLTNESFVPRQQAPEQRGELDALRELANSNARRALSRSDHRRTNTAFFFKLGVTAIAITAAVALLLLNGFNLNAPFAGMVSAIIVAILWGYDCVNHFKLIQNSNSTSKSAEANSTHSNAIQIGSNDGNEDRWRPSAS
jgi:hypothetical protein